MVLLRSLGFSKASDDFIVGEDDFSDLEISPTEISGFYYFKNKRQNRLIKQFVLNRQPKVDYLCQATLIKKGQKFTPRLSLSVRDKNKIIIEETVEGSTNIKANVNLNDCDENFWKLIKYLESLKELELPQDKFSLVTQSEADIVTALKGRDSSSVVSIIKELSSREDVKLSNDDVNLLLKRKEHLEKFENGLKENIAIEAKWQSFFEKNKWIFGYGLNYQILKQEQTQPHYGGTRVTGSGGQKGDFLTSTTGDLSFTVLVEIKLPSTPLLQGSSEIRNGAWSLSKALIDAVTQIQANIQTWDKNGSNQNENKDDLEGRNIYTVRPKGIIVIGKLGELDNRAKLETFQRFRSSLYGVEIITFDELYGRAKFIVEIKD